MSGSGGAGTGANPGSRLAALFITAAVAGARRGIEGPRRARVFPRHIDTECPWTQRREVYETEFGRSW